MESPTTTRRWLAVLLGLGVVSATGLLAGCEEGAFEEAGESLDDAADDVDDAF